MQVDLIHRVKRFCVIDFINTSEYCYGTMYQNTERITGYDDVSLN